MYSNYGDRTTADSIEVSSGLQSFLSDSSYAGDVRFPIVRHPLTMD